MVRCLDQWDFKPPRPLVAPLLHSGTTAQALQVAMVPAWHCQQYVLQPQGQGLVPQNCPMASYVLSLHVDRVDGPLV